MPAKGRVAEVDHLARAVFTLLLISVSLAVALGLASPPWLIDLIVPGFEGETPKLAIDLVVIVLPGLDTLDQPHGVLEGARTVSSRLNVSSVVQGLRHDLDFRSSSCSLTRAEL